MKTLFLLIVVILAGCATPNLTMVNKGEKYTPTSGVEVMFHVPSRPYKELAFLDIGTNNWFTEAKAIDKLRGRAAEVGADALIILPKEKTSQGFIAGSWYGLYGAQTSGSMMRALAVKFTD